MGWKLYHLWSTDWYRNRDLGRKKLLDFIEKSIKQTHKEQEIAREKEEKRRIEAEKRAEELRKKRERELEKQRKKETVEILIEIAFNLYIKRRGLTSYRTESSPL